MYRREIDVTWSVIPNGISDAILLSSETDFHTNNINDYTYQSQLKHNTNVSKDEVFISDNCK